MKYYSITLSLHWAYYLLKLCLETGVLSPKNTYRGVLYYFRFHYSWVLIISGFHLCGCSLTKNCCVKYFESRATPKRTSSLQREILTTLPKCVFPLLYQKESSGKTTHFTLLLMNCVPPFNELCVGFVVMLDWEKEEKAANERGITLCLTSAMSHLLQ